MLNEILPDLDRFKRVPPSERERRDIWCEALRVLRHVSRERPMSQMDSLSAARCLLATLGLDEGYLGYAMVMLNNAFWLEQFVGVPHERRLLLLPRCLARLGPVAELGRARRCRIHVADGSPIVVRILDEEDMDAVIGIGCMDSLEKAFEKVRQIGVPSIAIPLNHDGCADTTVDEELVRWFLDAAGPEAARRTRNYLPLLRSANRLFEPRTLERLLHGYAAAEDETARIALDWLRLGGKRLRPFVTLASYHAVSGHEDPPDAVKRAAVAIEAFHKASLVHDDIEDDEQARYDRPTIHRRYGTSVAINVGDYLVGLGYRLAAEAEKTGPGLVALLSDAHLRLTLGQGAELLWSARRPGDVALSDVLRSYTLKTSPAFEAALLGGALLADADGECRQPLRRFCKHLGAAFQVRNDLDGWQSDAAHVRPTVLAALALERADAAERADLLRPAPAGRIEEIYRRHDVFARADTLVDRLRRRATRIADAQDVPELADLLWFLVETIVP
jgi:geranylgeranyl pyrophosphate synthase